jgi:hypothetical protein
MMTIDKKITKKLLSDVMVEEEPEQGSLTFDDEWVDYRIYEQYGCIEADGDGTFNIPETVNGMIDSERNRKRASNGAIEVTRDIADEITELLSDHFQYTVGGTGLVFTDDARKELEASILSVVDLCKWKSGVSLYDLKLR